MTTDIVILNWNGKDFLGKYLPSVLRSVEGIEGVRVVVADNGSTDGSLRFLASEFPGVHTVRFTKNHGFAKGYNKALSQLQADCFILLNSDVEVPPHWLHPLIEWMELHPECGICGPKLHRMDRRDVFEYAGAAGGYIDRLGFPFCRGRVMDRLETDEGQYDIPADVFWVSGAALMVRSSLFHDLGGLCEDFIAHMEEIDLCWRARLEGWKVCVVPRSTVYHLGGGSLANDSPRKLFLNFRNNLLMLSRNLAKTCALNFCFNLCAEMTGEDEGPDSIENCRETFINGRPEEIAEISATMGLLKSNAIIRRRMLVDDIISLIYLLRGRMDYFKAVHRAHREFRSMRKKISEKNLAHFVMEAAGSDNPGIVRTMLCENEGGENFGATYFGVRGMWSKWCVWQNVFKKDAIFAEIKNLF